MSVRFQNVSQILVVADGHPDVGLGHLMRSTALACAIGLSGETVRCVALGAAAARTIDGVIWEPAQVPPDAPRDALVVLDSYLLDGRSRARLLDRPRSAVFGDAGTEPVSLSIAPALAPAPGRLSGLRHACLRRAFWVSPGHPIAPHPRRVLVSTGGGPAGDLRRQVAELVAEAVDRAEVRVVGAEGHLPAGAVSVRPPDLASELRAADLVVTAGGQTAVEAAATGTPAIAIAIVDNQRRQVRTLAEAGAVVAIEAFEQIPAAVAQLAAPGARRDLSRRGQAAVDGLGALRCAGALLRME